MAMILSLTKITKQDERIYPKWKSNKGYLKMRLFQNMLLVFLVTFTFSAMSQTRDSFTFSTKTIKTIIIETSELTILKTANSPEIKVSSSLKSQGKTYGFQFPSERPQFRIMKRISGDTLYIQTPKRFAPSTIGISTYREEIANIFEIPFETTVIVTKSERLQVLNYPNNLQVNDTRTFVGSELAKTNISRLECLATIGLTLNGKKTAVAYEINHMGSSTISIHANEIILTLK